MSQLASTSTNRVIAVRQSGVPRIQGWIVAPIRIMRALMRPVTVMAARSARSVQGWPHTSRVTIWAEPA